MLFFAWVENAQQCLPAAAPGAKFEVFEGGTCHDFFIAAPQIIHRHVGEVLPQEIPDVRRLGQRLGTESRCDDRVDNLFFHIANSTMFFRRQFSAPAGISGHKIWVPKWQLALYRNHIRNNLFPSR